MSRNHAEPGMPEGTVVFIMETKAKGIRHHQVAFEYSTGQMAKYLGEIAFCSIIIIIFVFREHLPYTRPWHVRAWYPLVQ